MFPRLAAFLALGLLTFARSSAAPRGGGDEFDGLVAAAKAAQSAGDFRSAESRYREALKIRQDIPELWANLGFMQNELSEYDQAISSFQAALRLNPALFAPNLFLGLDYLELKHPAQAIPYLRRAEGLDRADFQAPLALGRAFYALKEYSSAQKAFERASEIDPKREPSWFGIGVSYLREVENLTRTMLARDAASPYLRSLFADALVEQGKYAQAIEVYRELQKTTAPAYLCSRSALGFLLLRQKQIDEAGALFREELERNAGCGEARLGLAAMATSRGSYSEALDILELLGKTDARFVREHVPLLARNLTAEQFAALRLNARRLSEANGLSATLAALLNAGVGGDTAGGEIENAVEVPVGGVAKAAPARFYGEGRYSECSKALQRSFQSLTSRELELLAACSSETGDYRATSRAARGLALLGSRTAAWYWLIKSGERLSADALTKAELSDPDSPGIHALLGDIDRQRERYEEAIAEYQKTLALTPNHASALLGLATSYLMENRLDDAAISAQAALALQPDDPKLNLLMAELSVARRDYFSAAPFLQKSAGVPPELQARIHTLSGQVYAAEDRLPEAIAEMKQGLGADQDGSLHYQLARLYRRIGENSRAAELLEQMKTLQAERRERAVLAVENATTVREVEAALDEARTN